MKKAILIVACTVILITGGLLTGCGAPIIKKDAGPTTTREYNFTDFTGIEVGYAFELEVTPADTYKVSITASKNVLDRIDVSKVGSTLIIDMNAWFFSWHSTPKVMITMPSLQSLELSGASRGNIRGFKSSEDFDLTVSGASNLDLDMETGNFKSEISGASRVIGYLKASDSRIELSGASGVKLTGSGENLILSGSGASNVALTDFTVKDADIELSGASYAETCINGRMNVSLSGASTLEYGGNPTLGRLDITGGSGLKHREIK